MTSVRSAFAAIALLAFAGCESSTLAPLPDVTAGGAAIEIDGMLYPGFAGIRSVPGETPSRMIVLTTSDNAFRFHITPEPGTAIGEDFPLGDNTLATPTREGFSLERLKAAAASEGFSFVGDGSVANAGSMRLQASTPTNLSGYVDVRVKGPSDATAERIRIRFAAIPE